MNNVITIKDVRGYLDKNGTAHLNLEDVARGLGFTRVATSGNEIIRWERIRKYLLEVGVPTCGREVRSQSVGKENLPDFIPENIFYKLCFKASNETAKNFQNIVCDDILPTIRKTGAYSANGYNKKSTSIGEVTNLLKVLKGIMKDENHLPEDIANMAQVICNQFNIIIPPNFVKKSPYQQLALTIDFSQN